LCLTQVDFVKFYIFPLEAVLKSIAQVAAKNIKTEVDLSEFRQMLTKITVEAALNVELDEPLALLSTNKRALRAIVTVIRARRCKRRCAVRTQYTA
jgi:transposase-like protein